MKTHNSMMITGQRSVRMVSLAGHLSTIEPVEADRINDVLFLGGPEGKPVSGVSDQARVLAGFGFKKGDHIKDDQYILIRRDDVKGQNNAEINNAYIEGDVRSIRIIFKKPQSAAEMMGSRNDSIQNSFKHLAPEAAGSSADIYDRIERAREEDEE